MEFETNYSIEDSKLLYDMMRAYGFNPDEHDNIVELLQRPEQSISRYLREYGQYLLSEKVEYQSLAQYNLEGAKGYLEGTGEIVVPKSLEGDRYFGVPSRHKFYNLLEMTLDSAVISFQNSWDHRSYKQMEKVITLDQDMYLGFVADKYDPLIDVRIRYYTLLKEMINLYNNKYYTIHHDTCSNLNKELYLIAKKPNQKCNIK